MAKKSAAVFQVQFTARANGTLDACVGVAPDTEVSKNISIKHAKHLLGRILALKKPPANPPAPRPVHTICDGNGNRWISVDPGAFVGHTHSPQARWRWAQPLVNFLSKKHP